MNLNTIKPNSEKALFLAKRQLPELVYDAVNLEGIHYTLPEVQTLLDGITVGGHRQNDQIITLNQANAWQFLFDSIHDKTFNLSKDFCCQLHKVAAQTEALTWGEFRTGGVTIAGSPYTPPIASELNNHWRALCQQLTGINDPYDQAIYLFLQMARHQFFYDVNKRMGRFMMNGLLLQSGYPVINLPASQQETFNTLMLDFYVSNDTEPMTEFMKNFLDPRIIDIMSE